VLFIVNGSDDRYRLYVGRMKNVFEVKKFHLVSVMIGPGKGEAYEKKVERIDEEKIEKNNAGHDLKNHSQCIRHETSSV
jgi:hypothetical protein